MLTPKTLGFRIGLAAVLACCPHAATTAFGQPSRPAANAAATPVRTASARPNIVFILLDDVRYDDIIDNPLVQLPNLARLQAEGASLTRMFTSAPLCSPSRAVFMTGQYPVHNGILDNGERAEQSHRLVTFPRLLHDAGYRTGFFGKWHMGHDDDTARPGFDKWVSFLGQGVYFDPAMNIDGVQVKTKGYMTDILTNEAVSFIKANPTGQPFLAFIAQKASHPEIHPNNIRSFPPAPGDERLYEQATLPRSPAWRAPLDGKPALARPFDHTDPRSPPGGLPDAFIKDRLRMLSAVDRSIGTLIDTLAAQGILDQTVFIVTSDQGFFYGEFGLAQERRLAYDPSIHIPFIMRYPALARPGSRAEMLASNVDVAPTLLKLAGVKAKLDMDGRSLVTAIDNPGKTVRKNFLIQYYSDSEFPRVAGMGYKAVRTDRYKYIRYDSLKGMDELYDIKADPHELRNLITESESRSIVLKLQKDIDRVLKKSSSLNKN